jgi:hypothetical protein
MVEFGTETHLQNRCRGDKKLGEVLIQGSAKGRPISQDRRAQVQCMASVLGEVEAETHLQNLCSGDHKLGEVLPRFGRRLDQGRRGQIWPRYW